MKKEAKELKKGLNGESVIGSGGDRQREELETIREKLQSEEKRRKSSMFSDIKEVLKAVEYTKNQIDSNAYKLSRERANKMFYLLNAVPDEDSERLRMKKLVDGCIGAISNDVKVSTFF